MHEDAENAKFAEFAAHRTAVESSSKILPAIFSECTERIGSPFVFSEETYLRAEALIRFAADWDAVDYAFDLAHKGQWDVEVDIARSRISFSYSSHTSDSADTDLRSRELETVTSGERTKLDHSRIMELFQQLYSDLIGNARISGFEQCSYSYTPRLMKTLQKFAREAIKAVPEEMDAAVRVDDFTFASLREFWGALIALSHAHFAAHLVAMKSFGVPFPRRSMVLYQPTEALTSTISAVAELHPTLVEKLVKLHLYDHRVVRGPAIQPLIPLDTMRIALPSLLINGNNFERNFFKLLSKHPSLRPFASTVNSMKEPVALRTLIGLFPTGRYRTKSGIEIPGVTDIDLAVYEVHTGFTLLIQHKWLTPPETVSESSANDESLTTGVLQASKAESFVNAHPELLQQALHLKVGEISDIASVVICRGFEHTGFLPRQGIPIIAEVAFKSLVAESQDLFTLSRKLRSRPDRQKTATKVVDVDHSVRLGGYEFVLPYLARI
jgi:hypothetical protein